MKAKQFIPNETDFLRQIRTERREQTEKRLCRNSYGQDPIKEAIRGQSLKEYLRRKAKEQEARNRRTKANRARREEAEANRSRKPTTKEINEVLYYIGSYGKATERVINPILKTKEAEAETGQAGTPTGQVRPISNKDFIVLYYSNKLKVGGKNPREQDKADIIQENDIIKYLRHLNPVVKLTENGKHEEQVQNLYSIRYTTDQANTPQALKFLLTFKGEVERATNTQTTETGGIKPILSYNFISYEPNEIIIIGRKKDIKTIKKQFNRKNNPKNSFYNFTEENNPKQRIIRTAEEKTEAISFKRIRGNRNPIERERYLNRLRRPTSPQYKEYEKADTAGKAKIINYCLYFDFGILQVEAPEIKTSIIGLNNIRRNEEEVTKALREPKATKHQETAEAVQEAIQEAKTTDGRQKQANIEYDLRKALKHFKTETSTALYYIIEAIEEETEEKENGKRVLNQKKLTALLNVLKGFKSSKELIEENKDYLTEQLEEANGKNRSIIFKANKTRKNIYSNIYGVQKPNKNPQKCRNTTKKEAIATEQAKQERRQAKQQVKANERNNGPTFQELQRIARRQAQEQAGTPTADRIREQAHQRNKIKKEIKAFKDSITSKTMKQTININDLMKFKKANEI